MRNTANEFYRMDFPRNAGGANERGTHNVAEGAPEKPGSMREKESCADFGCICGVGKAVTNHHNAMY